jgi:hypothetical protein
MIFHGRLLVAVRFAIDAMVLESHGG